MASTGEVWKLGHRPALDGLRGIAVVMVVAEHVGVLRLGQVGVGIFFTLSGFLITALLLEEHAATGEINLPRFYLRRLFRLAPALAVIVAVVVLLEISTDLDIVTAAEVVSALTYVSNWHFIADGMHGALLHTWSLAVEEQFYLLFPVALLVGLRWGRRTVVGGMVGGILIAVALRAYLSGQGAALVRLGYGFDTRMDGLLVGCLLAVWMRNRSEGCSRPGLAAVAVVAAGLMGFASVASMPVAWPLVVALWTGVAIFACVQQGTVSWLAVRWLAAIGRRSYGLYLWHFPVAYIAWTLTTPSVLSIAVVTALSWLLAVLSWRYVERPALTFGRSLLDSRPVTARPQPS